MNATRRAPHVVCYAPYTTWSIHSARQVTILQALRLRGCSVSYVTCDGIFSDCDILQPATGAPLERPANACLICQSSVAAHLAAWGMPYRWFGRWLLPADFTEAGRWVLGLKPADFLTARHGDWDIGPWVQSSVHTHLRHNVLDVNDPKVAAVFASYLYSGFLACTGLTRLFDEEKPDAQLLFNGRMAPTRIALELAKRRGIRTLVEERGATPGHVVLFEDAHCLDYSGTHNLWRTWEHEPLTADEVERIGTLLRQRWTGKSGAVAFVVGSQRETEVRAVLKLSPDKPVWVLFTSNMDEVAGTEAARGAFSRHDDWVNATVAFAATHPDIQLVIRAHPNSGGKRSFGSNPQEQAFYADLATRLPPNVRLVPSTDPLNSYTLAAIAALGLVWHSTVGLEMAALGQPVVRCGSSLLENKACVVGADTPAAYQSVLEEFYRGRTVDPVVTAISAWRLAYTFFFRRALAFPLVKQPKWYVGEMNYDTLDALQPGRDDILDRICDTMMTGAALHTPPEPRPAAVAAHERAFILEQLAAARPGAA